MIHNKENSKTCGICSSTELEMVLHLPNLPLTSTFDRPTNAKIFAGHDLSLLTCNTCGHLQSASDLEPEAFYSFDAYPFRSSTSSIATRLNDALFDFIKTSSVGREYKCALEVGCNDFYLLKKLRPHCKSLVGLDPIWDDQHKSENAEEIHVLGCAVEDLTKDKLPEKPDLVILSHTLEHIEKPLDVLQKLISLSTDDALFVVEIPDFKTLHDRCRFDQVFHHHLHYFHEESLLNLISQLGCERVHSMSHNLHWGSHIVCFKKSKNTPTINKAKRFSKDTIINRFRHFEEHTTTIGKTIDMVEGDFYGYGAGQLLPAFAYHWKNDLSRLYSVLDDDPSKTGLSYQNLNLNIEKPETNFPFEKSTILLTALDCIPPIIKNLKEKNTYRIINPLTFM